MLGTADVAGRGFACLVLGSTLLAKPQSRRRSSAEVGPERLQHGQHTPAPASTSTLSALSPREREAARLAAAGLSDSAIAEQLRLSERTVESHLHQVFANLGVDRREDLPSVVPPGLTRNTVVDH